MTADDHSAYKSNVAPDVVPDIPSVIRGEATQLTPVPFHAAASHNAVHSSPPRRAAGAVFLKAWLAQNFIFEQM